VEGEEPIKEAEKEPMGAASLRIFAVAAACATGNLRQPEFEVDVLVLGAGMAGVKAAATLYEGGVDNFLVLEQSDRVGGRMWHRDWHGQTIELGANWIEGIPQDENPVWAIAQKIGLQGNYTDQEGSRIEPTLYDVTGKVPTAAAQKLHERLGNALDGAMRISCEHRKNNLGDISLRDAMSKSGWPPAESQTPLERTLEFFVVDWDFEYPPENVSMFNYFDVGKSGSWHEMCSSAKKHHILRRARTAARTGMLSGFIWEAPRFFVTDPRGYSAVAEYVASPLEGKTPPARANQDKWGGYVMFNKTVTSIDGSHGDSVRVHTTDGAVFKAKYAIVTFSSGVVNHGIKSKTLFHPPLPSWKADAYAKTQNGIYTKIFLRYELKFWDDADYILYADPDHRGYFAVWQDMESHGKFFPNRENILMVTVVQADSRRVEVQAKSETLQEVQTVLRRMYGESIPEPLDVFIPVWSTDPSFYGCWSNIAVGTTEEDFKLMQEPVGGLFFAGEATDYDYNGFVAGGFHSGKREAKKVMKAMRERLPASPARSLSFHATVTSGVGISPALSAAFLALGSLSCFLTASRRKQAADFDRSRAPLLSERDAMS